MTIYPSEKGSQVELPRCPGRADGGKDTEPVTFGNFKESIVPNGNLVDGFRKIIWQRASQGREVRCLICDGKTCLFSFNSSFLFAFSNNAITSLCLLCRALCILARPYRSCFWDKGKKYTVPGEDFGGHSETRSVLLY